MGLIEPTGEVGGVMAYRPTPEGVAVVEEALRLFGTGLGVEETAERLGVEVNALRLLVAMEDLSRRQ